MKLLVKHRESFLWSQRFSKHFPSIPSAHLPTTHHDCLSPHTLQLLAALLLPWLYAEPHPPLSPGQAHHPTLERKSWDDCQFPILPSSLVPADPDCPEPPPLSAAGQADRLIRHQGSWIHCKNTSLTTLCWLLVTVQLPPPAKDRGEEYIWKADCVKPQTEQCFLLSPFPPAGRHCWLWASGASVKEVALAITTYEKRPTYRKTLALNNYRHKAMDAGVPCANFARRRQGSYSLLLEKKIG